MNTYLKGFNHGIKLLSLRLQASVQRISYNEALNIQEIRLRIGKHLSVSIFDIEYFVYENGAISKSSNGALIVEPSDIEQTFNIACQYSVHSFQRELAQGFLTTLGGNRIGLCGTAVTKNGFVETIKDISSINIRIAREVLGCSNKIIQALFGQSLQSVLIIGPPSSGKTTVLRDLCRQLGQANKLSLIDERNEISATVSSIPQNDIGAFSDVFNGYPKSEGILTALRVMSPKVIICDEIGGKADIEALEQALYSGVKIIATAHAGSIEEAKKRLGISRLIELGAFDSLVLLGVGTSVGKLVKIFNIKEDKYEDLT